MVEVEDYQSLQETPSTPKQPHLYVQITDNHETKTKHKLTVAEAYAQGKPFSQQENPLHTASFLSEVSTHWLQPMITLGSQKILDMADIWPICPQDSCETLYARFERVYDPSDRQYWHGIPPIGLALMKTFQRELLISGVSMLLYVACMAMQPFFSWAVLDYLNDRTNVFHIDSGAALVVLMTVVSFVGVTSLNYGIWLMSRIGVNMRSVLMDIVYRKALRLSCVGRQAYTTGEIVTLMSVDSERIFNAMVYGPWVLVVPITFIIAITLIAIFYDVVASICGGVFLVFVLIVSVRLAFKIGDLQDELFKIVEERVKVTSEALQGIRVMKFYAWEESLANRVQKLREIEVSMYRKFHFLQVTNTTLLFLTPVYAGGIILGIYVARYGSLTVTEVFTLIAMVNISRMAVTMYPLSIASLSQVTITFQRMDAYLGCGELALPSSNSATLSLTGNEQLRRGTILVHNAQFQWSLPSSTPDMVVVSSIHLPSHENHGENVTLSPEVHDRFCLEGVNLEIDAGSLVMIVGTVGSGKSSLLNALLGEMITTAGKVEMCGELSYVSQEAWIRNSTVKENILFESQFDSERYRQVLDATQLTVDLYALPDGDQTEIGERGINMSGGQKARVAIARAMYRSNYDILILDDPLSAVDPHVAHAIFNQCILGLAKDKTRLLVLNSHYDLLVNADKILVMQDGRIAGDGTYSEVLAQFPELGQQSKLLDKLEQDVIDEHDQAQESQLLSHVSDDAPKMAAPVLPKDQTNQDNQKQAKDGDGNRLIQDEDRVKGKVTGQTYKAYFDETGFDGWLVLFVLVMVYLTSQGVRILVDWWQGYWAKNMVRDGVDPTYSVSWYVSWYYGFIVLCTVMIIGRGLFMMESCIRSSKNLHDELFRRVLRAPVNQYFDVTPVGRILNRFSNDLDQLDSNLPYQYQNVFQNLAQLVGSLVVCAMASLWIGLSYIPIFVIFVMTGLYFKKTSREVKRLEGINRTPVFNLFGETLNGLETVRAFKMQETFIELNKRAVDSNTSMYFTYWGAGRWLAVRLDWLSVVIIFVVTLYLVATKGQISPVLAGFSLTYSLMMTSMVQSCVRNVDSTDNAMTSVERLLHFREIPFEDDGANCTPINSAIWPSQGAVRFDNLHLKYRPELPLVLRGVNMDIGGGEKVGICGRTGAGKSSLMIALFRICEFESGTIFIDDLDIKNVKLQDLRRSLAIIPQDPVLFSGSLRENLDPFGDYSDNAIWSVLQQVHLSDSVTKWGAGLEFVVSESGDNLSVGQRQLLCIGRALLKNSKIVVLDEATANVDTATDTLIQKTIKETFVSKTVLIIAHRINTIMHCDKIAVMDAGQVAEFGSPTDLLRQPDSIFTSLAKKSAKV